MIRFVTMKYHRVSMLIVSLLLFSSFIFLKKLLKLTISFIFLLLLCMNIKLVLLAISPKNKDEKQGQRRIQIITGLLCLSDNQYYWKFPFIWVNKFPYCLGWPLLMEVFSYLDKINYVIHMQRRLQMLIKLHTRHRNVNGIIEQSLLQRINP